VLLDTEEALSQTFNVQVLPSIAILDRKGVVRYLDKGFDAATISTKVEELLAEK
jgi:hypothetical protein